MPHRSARLTAAVTACLAVAFVGAPGAAAAADQWWVTAFKLAENHTVADGAGVTVAVLDGIFSPTAPSVAGIDLVPPTANACVGEGGATGVTGDAPTADHATAMVTTLAGQGTSGPVGAAPGAKVLVYNVGVNSDTTNALVCRDPATGLSIADTVVGAAIDDAVARGARIVSMSFGGGNLGGDTETAILFAERKGVVFVASTNDQPDHTGTRVEQPAVFNGVVAVNGADRDAQLIADSATGAQDGPLVSVVGPGADMAVGGYTAPGTWDAGAATGGSSAATAFVAGVLATTLSKYPGATGNQLIQSLAHNTGGETHEPELRGTNGFGWGAVSLTAMLADDPTAYPDENPLLRDGADPATSEILQGSSGSAAPSSATPSSGSAAPSSPEASSTPVAAAADGTSTGLVIGIVVGVLVLLALLALVIVLVRRRGRSGRPPTSGGPPMPGGPPVYGGPPPVPTGHR